jgi:hypothetical protein
MLKIGKIMSQGADVNTIAEAHGKSGLGVTYNFMFGLPGETEEDAFEALEFLRRNNKYRLSVNPSSHFCGFAPGTLAYEDPKRYGIDLSKGGLFWETIDGTNTYITRLKRLVHELGIQTTYPSTILLDRNRTLGQYFEQVEDTKRASWYFESWLEEHPEDMIIRNALEKIKSSAISSEKISLISVKSDNKPDISYSLQDHTDDNWLKGVSRSWATAIFIVKSMQSKNDFTVGRKVMFSDESTRRIVRIQENAETLIVYFEGSPLDGDIVGYPKKVTLLGAATLKH